MICAASVCVQSAPGGDPGCQVYVAGDTLVRREKVEVKTKLCRLIVLYDLECMLLCHVMFRLCIHNMVYLGDGSGIAVMPSVPILVVCITKEIVC